MGLTLELPTLLRQVQLILEAAVKIPLTMEAEQLAAHRGLTLGAVENR